MIKAIIFDLGGVILKHKANLVSYILSEMFPISQKEGHSLWEQYKMKLLKGEMSSEKFLKELKSKIETQYTVNELYKIWEELYVKNAEIDWEVLDFIDDLKEKYEVYLLTDTIEVHDKYNKERKIYDKFTKVFKSHEEKLAKAEGKGIFLSVLKKINIAVKKCVFIDDLDEHVKTAQSIGMKGIVFKNLTQLKRELKGLSIV